jgi:PAS domain S-box-containing protein
MFSSFFFLSFAFVTIASSGGVMAERPSDPRPPDDVPDRRPDSTPAPRLPVRLDAIDIVDVFSSLPVTIWTTDRQLVVTSAQGQLIRQWQVDPSRFIGRTLADLLLDGREDHPFIQAHLAALAGYDSPVRVEWGGMLYGVRIGPLRDESGQIVGSIGVQQQMGWLPDDEDTLRESDVRLRRVIDSCIVGIAFGDDEGRVTDANEAFLQIAGVTREDLMADGLSWPALTPVEHQGAVIAALGEILATGRCRPFEAEIIRRDGRRVAVVIGAVRLSVERREGVAFVLDVTERKRTTRRLEVELAVADAVAEAGSAEAAVRAALAHVRDGFGWMHAHGWMCQADGALMRLDGDTDTTAAASDAVTRPLATDALTRPLALDAVSRPLALDAMRTGDVVTRQEGPAAAIPLGENNAIWGALVLVGRAEVPDADTIAACARIGRRITTRFPRG